MTSKAANFQRRSCRAGRPARRAQPYATSESCAERAGKGLLVLLAFCTSLVASEAKAQKFRADEWITECDRAARTSPAECSITVPFWQNRGEPKGAFALVIMLQTGNIGIVGQPFPVKAVLRVDKNPPVQCTQQRYCVFPSVQALSVLKQLKIGSLILIDVYTAKGVFNFSLTPKGFQAGMAQIRAWGYRAD
jgi:hypothetical protein